MMHAYIDSSTNSNGVLTFSSLFIVLCNDIGLSVCLSLQMVLSKRRRR